MRYLSVSSAERRISFIPDEDHSVVLTRTKQPKVCLIIRNYVPQKLCNIRQRARLRHSRLDVDRIILKLGHPQRLSKPSTVRDLVRRHSLVAVGRERSKLGNEFPLVVEQFLGLVGLHPVLEQRQVFLVLRDIGKRDLMGSPVTFQVMSTDVSGARPSFRGTQDDHRPSWSERFARVPRLLLVFSDLGHALFEGGRHGLVHRVEVGTFDKVRSPAVADEEGLKFFVGYSGQNGGVVDLVTGGRKD